MNNPQVARQIAKLKDENEAVRRSAIEALGEIGSPAIPGLLEVLADANPSLRENAVYALGMIGTPALPALIHALDDPDASVRRYALEALGMIGTFALPALISALKDQDESVRRYAAKALMRNGDSETFPRKILAEARWSAQQRIDILEELRGVHYNRHDIALFYRFPETHVLCQIGLKEADVAACAGAQEVLNWLLLSVLRSPIPANRLRNSSDPHEGKSLRPHRRPCFVLPTNRKRRWNLPL